MTTPIAKLNADLSPPRRPAADPVPGDLDLSTVLARSNGKAVLAEHASHRGGFVASFSVGTPEFAADLACHVKALLCEVERLRELTRPQSAKVVPPKAAYLPGPAPEPAAVAGAADRWGRVATGKPAADVYNSRVLNPDGKSPNEDRAILANAYAVERGRLREALTWAVGFIRCNFPQTVAPYPDYRNACDLIAGVGEVITGEFTMTRHRAELAEWKLKKLRQHLTWDGGATCDITTMVEIIDGIAREVGGACGACGDPCHPDNNVCKACLEDE